MPTGGGEDGKRRLRWVSFLLRGRALQRAWGLKHPPHPLPRPAGGGPAQG